MRKIIGTAVAILLAATAVFAHHDDKKTVTKKIVKKKTASLETRRKALSDLLAEHWEYIMVHNPEFASLIGDKRFNDKVSDFSQREIDEDFAASKKFLARFEAIDTTGFPDQEVLNQKLMVRNLRNGIEDHRFKNWQMPVNQMGGIHLDSPQMVSLMEFKTVKDYDDFITRLRGFPRVMDDTIYHMRAGLASGQMPPKFLLEKVITQTEGFSSQTPEASPFAEPLKQIPDAIPAAQQERIRKDYLAAIRDQILPSYVKFAKFLKEEYVPKGRTQPGMWSLPNGAERYAVRVKRSTTTEMTPEEIHQLGLREVARIEKEMLVIANKLGFKDLKSFNASIEANPKLKATSRQNMLDIYRLHIDAMWAKLPQLFGTLPKAKVEIRQVEVYREKEASGAQYNQGTPDGSRPGQVLVNTADATSRKTISFESTAYHEGVPGHHMQISIAQELPSLPPFRQQGGYTAYVEGWALYSERLGKEVGFYQDPYSDYGRLQDEMLRAIRLVVDTGFHYKKWSRDQVVKFFHDHSAIDEVEVQSETDRYIVWPAQALGYKIGQLRILELRESAKKALGSRFDIRGFHDEVLNGGALPLDVLEERIARWVEMKKKS